MRLFAALVPPVEVLDHLENALALVKPGTPRQRLWLPRNSWHITLAFFGEVPAAAIPGLEAELGQLAETTAPLELALAGAGRFSSRTAWVGVGGQTSQLKQLMSAAAECWLADPDPSQSGKPHLTIARRSTPLVQQALQALAVYRGPSWQVSSFSLFRSDLGASHDGHPLYTELTILPLGDHSGG